MLEIATLPVTAEASGEMFARVGAFPIHATRSTPRRTEVASSGASAAHHVITPASEPTRSIRPHRRAPVAGWRSREVVDVWGKLHEPRCAGHHHVVHHPHHVGVDSVHVWIHSIHIGGHSIHVRIHPVHILRVEVRCLVAHVGHWVASFVARVEGHVRWWKLGCLGVR